MPSSCGILTSMMTRSGRSSVASCDRGLTVAGLADDLEPVVAQNLDDVEADQRLVLRDDDASGGGCCGWSALAQSHVSSLRYSRSSVVVWRNGRRGALKMLVGRGVRVPPPDAKSRAWPIPQMLGPISEEVACSRDRLAMVPTSERLARTSGETRAAIPVRSTIAPLETGRPESEEPSRCTPRGSRSSL